MFEYVGGPSYDGPDFIISRPGEDEMSVDIMTFRQNCCQPEPAIMKSHVPHS